MNKWTDIDELVQNIIAVAVVGVTLALEATSAFNPAVQVPVLLEGAAGAVLLAYGYNSIKSVRSNATSTDEAAKTATDSKEKEVAP
jgi:hypothetical protein